MKTNWFFSKLRKYKVLLIIGAVLLFGSAGYWSWDYFTGIIRSHLLSFSVAMALIVGILRYTVVPSDE